MNIERSLKRVKQSGEVFTPINVVCEMLREFSPETWTNPNKTFIDPAAGDGNFLKVIKRLLLKTLSKKKKEDGELLYKGKPIEDIEAHILENMLFAVDIMPDNIEVLQHRLGYLINDERNKKLKEENFDKDDLTHECFILEPDHNRTYYHHRNIVCANSLEYDFSFWRKPDGSEYTEEELKLKEIEKRERLEEEKRMSEQKKKDKDKPMPGLLDF